MTSMPWGEFDDLPGRGEPPVLKYDSIVPEEYRLTSRVL